MERGCFESFFLLGSLLIFFLFFLYGKAWMLWLDFGFYFPSKSGCFSCITVLQISRRICFTLYRVLCTYLTSSTTYLLIFSPSSFFLLFLAAIYHRYHRPCWCLFFFFFFFFFIFFFVSFLFFSLFCVFGFC